MTVKQFFKSTTFKCIIALLCILLVCGVFLTVAYGFLEVTEGERLQRAINKLYGGNEVTVYGLNDQVIDSSVRNPESLLSQSVSVNRAEITAAYKVEFTDDDGEHLQYLVLSKGKDGEGGGSVTCWVAVEVKYGAIDSIYNVSINTNDGQEYIGRFGSDYFDKFKGEYSGEPFSTTNGYINSGATFSSNAINNSINGAIDYVKSEWLGEELSADAYTAYIDLSATSFDKSARKFTIVTKNNTETGLRPKPFTIEIVVTDNRTIESFNIVTNGSTGDKWLNSMKEEVKSGTLFTGKNLAQIEALIKNGEFSEMEETDELSSGATQSNFLCGYACAYALSHFYQFMGGNN